MITMCIKLDKFEDVGIGILQNKQGRSKKAEIIRSAIREYLEHEGITKTEIQDKIKTAL